MAISLGSNIGSLKALRQLGKVTDSLSRVYERLASGSRIIRASDDAAGLSVSSLLSANSRVFTQGVRNLNDGLSVLNIADSATEQLTNIVIRIRELATQAASGTFSAKQRDALDTEAQALSKEYTRIAKTTSFNGLMLFDGSTDQIRLQAGYGVDGSISASVGGAMGTGTFVSAASYSVSATTLAVRGVVLGDLNNDGNLDMVGAGDNDAAAGGFMTVRLGAGDGSFSGGTSYATESSGSTSLALGDINQDGVLDVVTAGVDTTNGSGYATVRIGNGDGTFRNSASYTTEDSRSNGVALGDLNGDSFLDLVTTGSTDSGNGYTTVRLGQGNGSFGAAVSYASETLTSNAVALRDLNGDETPDLITAGTQTGSGGFFTVRLGAGDGTFKAATSYAALGSNIVNSLAIADLNNDGIMDVGIAGRDLSNVGAAYFRLGRGDGSFGSLIGNYRTEPNQSNALIFGDLNGDGINDLISAGYNNTTLDGNANVRLGNGDGTFAAAVSYLTDSLNTYGLALGDLDNDGVLDLFSAGRTGASDASSTVLLGSTRSGVNPLLPFSLSTMSDAKWAMSLMDKKLAHLTSQRGSIGSFISRAEVATRVLAASSENSLAAAGRISDVDIAQESAELTRSQILQKAATAVLAQANLTPALALSVLKT